MKIEILTIFPEIFSGFLSSSLIKKGIETGLLSIQASNFRDFASEPHHNVDDTPYGGGAGMVIKPEPIVESIENAKLKLPKAKVILLSPAGSVLNQKKAYELSLLPEIILVCGRYEGVDQRAIEVAIDEEISIGDYILMGGEIASMVVIETITRLIPGVLGNNQSIESESFSRSLIEAPHYTRPAEYRGLKVPAVLLSGDHKAIAKWREEMSLKITVENRPDLLSKN
ncbi:MAG: tRNA (guanosine(37)-N1)-methyltransferase TrmD [bacterium]|nr:tRNA (guanosine(37)-N1)-methyltransferase TrmD [bacterium]